MGLFKLTATGHLGHSCKIKDVNGTNAISFSIACTERYKDKTGQQMEKTIWLDCTIWMKPEKSGIAQYLKRGTQVCVVGRPDSRAYTSRQTGEPVSQMTLKVDEIHLLGGTRQEVEEESNNSNSETHLPDPAQEDDLPF